MNYRDANKHLIKLPATAYLVTMDKYIIVRFFRYEGEKVIIVEQAKFYFKEHGIETASKARIWRNMNYLRLLCEEKINPYRLNRPTRGKQDNNKSGTAGVFFTKTDRYIKNRNGKTYLHHIHECYAVWIEYMRINGIVLKKRGQKVWGVKKWGEDGAYQMACEVREQKEIYLNSPEHIRLQLEYRAALKKIKPS